MAFEAFTEIVLTPTLRPGGLVILDNRSSRKGPRVARPIQAAQADVLCIRPHSPDLNPIKDAFTKVKETLRSAEQRPIPDLWTAIQSILDRITARDAEAGFRRRGSSAWVHKVGPESAGSSGNCGIAQPGSGGRMKCLRAAIVPRIS